VANKFFAPGLQRSEKVDQLFTAIAPHYDLINDLQSLGLHRYWKRRVVKLAGVRPGDQALDICCGTGDLSLALDRCGAQTIGLDFNEQMLRVAERRKCKVQSPESEVHHPSSILHPPVSGYPYPASTLQNHASRITHHASLPLRFVRGDAQQLPFDDNSFDIVTVGYGLRNLASWETGLAEMRRVAKPGGRLLVLEFGKPDNPLWRGLYFGYLRLFVPVLGRLICGDAGAYAYILESLKHYPAQHALAEHMRGSGLVSVRIFNLLGGIMSIHYAEKRPV
jgi:demethylmenaquinone methyltransferase/2-methoxy-6-polyprenyl-1,4-benzoquinol methylase